MERDREISVDTMPESPDLQREDEQTVADVYGETDADQDFEPGTDELGMGTDEDTGMISDEQRG